MLEAQLASAKRGAGGTPLGTPDLSGRALKGIGVPWGEGGARASRWGL